MGIVEDETTGMTRYVPAATPASQNCANVLLVLETHASHIKSPMEEATFHWKEGLGVGRGGSIGSGIGLCVAGFFAALKRRIPELAFENIMLTE
jgi:hypothetical protein